jgi:uncharacterized protein YndB with AHSA1/START domain
MPERTPTPWNMVGGPVARFIEASPANQRSAISMRIVKLSAALLAAWSLLQPALAAGKPDAAIKTPAIEASVFLNAQIKADPALAASCLAEGKKWIDKNASSATAERKRDPRSFDDGAWNFERKYSVRSDVAGRYVSVVRDDYINTHGAHPNSTIETILWDKAEKKRISIRAFFTETADNGPTMQAMLKAVIASLTEQKTKRGAADTATDEWLGGLKPALLKIGAVTLAPSTDAGKSSGLTVHYSPYEVGPYAEGEYIAFVPWETLKAHLSPEGQRIFGGSRPKQDAQEN